MLLTCDQFQKESPYSGLEPGTYDLYYNDSSHLTKDEWPKILEIDIRKSPHEQPFLDAERSLLIRVTLSQLNDQSLEGSLRDVIALSFARVGIIQPELPQEIFRQVSALQSKDGIVLIPDSNSLYNGSLHWLLRVLRDSTVWILPFVVSLTQIQERDARLKNLVRSGPDKKGRQALRLRATINSSLSLLQRNKSKYQVLELDPSLLRYLKLSPSDGEGNVLEDRLLIEGVHAVLKATRTRARQVVVTSDVLLARVLEAEGIDHLFLPPPRLQDGDVSNIRYDPLARTFTGAPLRLLLWDLAHALSSVRLQAQGKGGIELSTYWASKTPEDWRLERLSMQTLSPTADPAATVTGPRKLTGRRTGKAAPKTRPAKSEPGLRPAKTDSFLPRASLIQVLRVGSAARRVKQGLLVQIVEAMHPNDRPTAEIARRALQTLERIGAVKQEGAEYLSTSVLDEIDDSISNDSLDDLHRIFMRFRPYAIVADALSERSEVGRADVEPLLRKFAEGDLNTDAAERLPRFHTLMGQAWTDGDKILNGSKRPSLHEFAAAFGTAFEESQQDGFARVDQLIPALARGTEMSPWSIHRYINSLASGGMLRSFSLQPAAGKRPVTRDKVLSGSLDDVTESPVPVDRLFVGGRPIFTIGRGF